MSVKPAILVAHEWRSPVVLLPRDCSPGWCKATEQRTRQKFNTGIQDVRQPYRGLINLPHTPGWPGDWDAFRKDTGWLHWEQRAKVDLEPTWPSEVSQQESVGAVLAWGAQEAKQRPQSHKDVHVLILKAATGTFQSKRDIDNVIKGKGLKMEKVYWIIWVCFIYLNDSLKAEDIFQLGQKDAVRLGPDPPCWLWNRGSRLARKIPWIEGPGRLQSMGLQRVGHGWATSLTHRLWAKRCHCPPETEKDRKWILLPRNLQKGMQACQHYDFSHTRKPVEGLPRVSSGWDSGLPTQGPQVQTLVEGLRSHVLQWLSAHTLEPVSHERSPLPTRKVKPKLIIFLKKENPLSKTGDWTGAWTLHYEETEGTFHSTRNTVKTKPKSLI